MARFSKNDFGLSLVGSAVLRLINLDKPLITLKANDFIWGYDDDLFKFSKFDPTSTVPMDRVGLLTSVTALSTILCMYTRVENFIIYLPIPHARITWGTYEYLIVFAITMFLMNRVFRN